MLDENYREILPPLVGQNLKRATVSEMDHAHGPNAKI